MSKKKSYIPKKYESLAFGDPQHRYTDKFGKKRTDSFCMLWDSQLQSPAFIDLTPVQKNVYVLCVQQLIGHRKPEKDYKEPEFQGDDIFYLNWREVHERYGMYSAGNHSRFYRDMQALEEHGFIRKISSGKNHHKKSIYQMTGLWQTWKP